MTKQEQIKKGILQVMACGGEVGMIMTRSYMDEFGHYDEWSGKHEDYLCGSTWKYAGEIDEDLLISHGDGDVSRVLRKGSTWISINDSGIKPIFHRITSLTKEITVEGETFVPKERLKDYWTEFPKGAFEARDVDFWYSGITDQLHAWGFFTGPQQLFESGDLIDKLTLKK